MTLGYNYPGSAKNSTNILLGAGEVFTGTVEALSITESTQSVSVTAYSDVASAADGLVLQFSADGVTFDSEEAYTVLATIELSVEANARHRYVRVKYTNGGSVQTAFRLQTRFNSRFGADSDPGHPVPVRISDGATFSPLPIIGSGAFGDVVTAELTPRVQKDFVYGGDSDALTEHTSGTGSVSYSGGMAEAQSGGAGTAQVITTRVVKYRPGQGAVFRFTGLFDSPDASAEQIIGAFSCSTNALVFGYNGADFGLLRRHSGRVEVQSLTVTVAASGAETVTITLNGTAHNVAVTAGSVEANAQEIAEGTYPGWVAEATGDEVHFLGTVAVVNAGAFTISSTGTADGTYSQEWDGAAPTNEWVLQSAWNVDRFDGTGPSGVTLDPEKGNVFQISLQYLGFGGIAYYIEDPKTRKFQPVHIFEYANTQVIPNVTNPTFHLGLCCSSTSADKTVRSASVSGFNEGPVAILGPFHGHSADGSATGGAETPIISIRNTNIFHSGAARTNLRDIIPAIVSAATTGTNKPVKVSIVINGTLTNPLWVNYDTGHSIVDVDESATGISGGEIVASLAFQASGSAFISLTSEDISIVPGDIISLVMTPSGTSADFVASLSWREDI